MLRPTRALIVLDRTPVTARLIDVVRWRARQRAYRYSLLVPKLIAEELFGDEEAQRTIERSLPALQEAAGSAVSALIGPADALRRRAGSGVTMSASKYTIG